MRSLPDWSSNVPVLVSIGPDIPLPAKIALGVLIAVQVCAQIVALIDLVRRPAALVNGPKLLWAAVILLGNLLGPVLYFVVGRNLPPAAEPRAFSEHAADRAASAADLLYGRDERR